MARTFAVMLVAMVVVGATGCAGHESISWQVKPEELKKIEQSSFMDAYNMWRQENESLARNAAISGSYVIPAGVRDPATGRFTPSRIAALNCRLGLEADKHEDFLRKELASNHDVFIILDSSEKLCRKYGITSMAAVVYVPGQGYIEKTNNGYSPQSRQAVWLKAMYGQTSPLR
jgi:hypothetical protein